MGMLPFVGRDRTGLGPVTTDPKLAWEFCAALFEELRARLSDPAVIHSRMAQIESHAPTFPEVLFCKGCVLPIVDAVATRFLRTQLSLSPADIHSSLRCEGYSSLPKIYSPRADQSGFSGFTWGTNYQRTDKKGTTYPEKHPGSRPCPDFSIIHRGERRFTLLGETKFKRALPKISTGSLERELRYYLTLPTEADKEWDYDCGFGIAYAAGGFAPRRAALITEHWATDRFVIAHFYE